MSSATKSRYRSVVSPQGDIAQSAQTLASQKENKQGFLSTPPVTAEKTRHQPYFFATPSPPPVKPATSNGIGLFAANSVVTPVPTEKTPAQHLKGRDFSNYTAAHPRSTTRASERWSIQQQRGEKTQSLLRTTPIDFASGVGRKPSRTPQKLTCFSEKKPSLTGSKTKLRVSMTPQHRFVTSPPTRFSPKKIEPRRLFQRASQERPLERNETQVFSQASMPNSNSKNASCALLAKDLTQYETTISLEVSDNENFTGGGEHKKFNPKGVLRTDNSSVAKEFFKEQKVAAYIEDSIQNRPLVNRLKMATSFQKPLTNERRVELGLKEKNPAGKDYYYAEVKVYNKDKVYSKELDLLLLENKLSKQQVIEIAKQVMDIMRDFYLAKIYHRDPHMHNFVIHIHEEKVLVVIIDFGKALWGEDFIARLCKYDDLDYQFLKKATNPADMINRNYLRPLLGKNKAQQKHYLFYQVAKYLKIDSRNINDENFLEELGTTLKNALNKARNESDIIFVFDVQKDKLCRWLEKQGHEPKEISR